MLNKNSLEIKLTYEEYKKQVIDDYKVIFQSREASLLGRREVLSGKAKFGIFGDGKELPQVVLSKFFKNGDFRAGYYRDQTILFSQEKLTLNNFFSALYANTDLKMEPMSGGRQMGGHFVTPSNDQNGDFYDLVNQKNHSSDISPVAGQIPRLVGLGQASKLYRNYQFKNSNKFSNNGNEIAWGTIGNAATSEGLFFESINACGVLQIPVIISVWDDEYGISVHNKHQTTKESISEALEGFRRDENKVGFEILTVNGWDYVELIKTYKYAEKIAREDHVPVLVHVKELTQPLGHSTSGSHQRYKSKNRLNWEAEFDCNLKMRDWIIKNGISSENDLIKIEENIKNEVKNAKNLAWKNYLDPIIELRNELITKIEDIISKDINKVSQIQKLKIQLLSVKEPNLKSVFTTCRKILRHLREDSEFVTNGFKNWFESKIKHYKKNFSSFLYSESKYSLRKVNSINPVYENNNLLDGRIVIRDNFDKLLEKYDNLIIFGQDVGLIGDVNQGLEGLQKKYGEHRVSDTGIREASSIGQGIGLALRGFRPIVEIQYLDYILYCMATLSDDLSTYLYRTVGRQSVPLIVRTRGHRLEGIWHSGSPMGGLLNLLKGINIIVPRNMTNAAGFYNSLMDCDEPALVIEPLNGYRIKEKLPKNLGEFKIKVGEIEIINEGTDITVISYGSTINIISEILDDLKAINISVELIDIQTLIPFDLNQNISKSIKKTNRFLIVDEDVPGGASAFILDQLINNQKIYKFLDSSPTCLTASEHRPAYGSDGDYFSKPSSDDIFEKIYSIMNEYDPVKYKKLF